MATKRTGSWSEAEGREAKNGEHLGAMEAAAAQPAAPSVIQLQKLDIQTMQLRIVGDSALIVHRFDEKAKKQMGDKQGGKASAGREKKVPEDDYRRSMYVLPDGGYGFPAIAFKNASVEACTSIGRQSITKVAARQCFHVVGDLVRIEGEPSMREDTVRLSSGVADLRYRAQFLPWRPPSPSDSTPASSRPSSSST